MVTRNDVLKYVYEKYGTKSEHLWAKFPTYEVLRQSNNSKWYAALLDVQRNKVGLEGDEMVDILDLKCEPDMVVALAVQEGFAPAYHMNKKHWITVILDGTVQDEVIYNLIDLSYEITE